jgi:hypothetical protein
MRSANEPGGGGLDEAGAAFEAEEALLLDADFAAFGAGFGRDLGAVDVVAGFVGAGLVGTGLPGARFSNFDGRCSCSSALRFVPAAATFCSEEASRDGVPGVLGLRTSDLAVEDETGGSGRRDVAGGIADGFPVSMDVSTESRN